MNTERNLFYEHLQRLSEELNEEIIQEEGFFRELVSLGKLFLLATELLESEEWTLMEEQLDLGSHINKNDRDLFISYYMEYIECMKVPVNGVIENFI